MNKIKKTLLTLVALLAISTGAWAETWNSGACTVTLSGDVMTVSGTGAMEDYLDTNFTPWYGYTSDTKTIVIESGVTGIGNFAFSRSEKLESVSIPASVTSIGKSAFGECGSDADAALTVSFAEGSAPLTIGEYAFNYANLTSIDIPNRVTSIGERAFASCSNLESVSIPASVTSIGDGAFYSCGMLAKVYIYAPSLTTYGNIAFEDNASGRKIHVLSDAVDTYKAGWPAYAADIVGDLQPLASGPEVTWDKAEKTGSFTMPGGNVTLEPEYYPQATAAEGAVTAATDAKATTDAPLVTIDETKLTGATKMMYYVSTDATAPAYDAEGWTDVLPTAEKFTEAANLNVWYYPVGTDEGVGEATATYSDGDMNATALAVTLAAAPLWNAEFDLTNAPEEDKAGKWSTDIPEGGVVKGTEVKVTYTGTKKVIGVKAEKKAAAGIVNPVVGQIIGSDGKNYDANATLPSGVTAVAKIAYVGNDAETSTTYNHGLALALGDVSDKKAWCSQYQKTCLTTQYGSADAAKGDMAGIANTDALVNHTGHSHAAASAARDYNGGTHPMGTSEWFLPSAGQWDKMASAAGGYVKLRTNAGLQSDYYWSSTERDASYAWYFSSHNGDWLKDYKDMYSHRVRACLAF